MPSTSSAKQLDYLYVVLGILAVGAVDHLTGSDIHVVSLYLIPLAYAGWRLGRVGATITSLLATSIWLVALYTTGIRYAQFYIWIINFVTQCIAFLTASLLVAILAAALRREQARSRTDPLTGLLNRQGFVEQASSALSHCKRHGRPVALAFIDLDNFKNVNDSLGHARGDTLLQAYGRIVSESLRASDVAARLGGDEFAIFLSETNSDNATSLVERLRVALDVSGGMEFAGATASIGVVVDELATSSIEELLRCADAQMYEVKRSGKNRVAIRRLADSLATPMAH